MKVKMKIKLDENYNLEHCFVDCMDWLPSM